MQSRSNDELTEKKVRDWLAKARIKKLNIFDDRTDIIRRLCVALLASWGKDPDRPM